MVKGVKVTDNEVVAEWLIQNRWKDALNLGTRMKMPAFVEDAVIASVYIVAGTSNGKVNISPKLVFKSLMLSHITVENVKKVEIGYGMSTRQAQRLAQTARFALDGIKYRIQEYENNVSEEVKMNWRLERKFVQDYYDGVESVLYSPPAKPHPIHLDQLRIDKKYSEYALALRDFRHNS